MSLQCGAVRRPRSRCPAQRRLPILVCVDEFQRRALGAARAMDRRAAFAADSEEDLLRLQVRACFWDALLHISVAYTRRGAAGPTKGGLAQAGFLCCHAHDSLQEEFLGQKKAPAAKITRIGAAKQQQQQQQPQHAAGAHTAAGGSSHPQGQVPAAKAVPKPAAAPAPKPVIPGGCARSPTCSGLPMTMLPLCLPANCATAACGKPPHHHHHH